jgi:hypothetical protein
VTGLLMSSQGLAWQGTGCWSLHLTASINNKREKVAVELLLQPFPPTSISAESSTGHQHYQQQAQPADQKPYRTDTSLATSPRSITGPFSFSPQLDLVIIGAPPLRFIPRSLSLRPDLIYPQNNYPQPPPRHTQTYIFVKSCPIPRKSGSREGGLSRAFLLAMLLLSSFLRTGVY